MNKHDLIEAMAEAADISKVAAETALNTVTNAVESSLQSGGEVAIAGFGSFKKGERKAREGRNPRTGETIQIAASNTVKFKAAKKLKDAIN